MPLGQAWTVPKGATLPLVLEKRISSATSRSGDLVRARLAEDVKVGEKVVVPAGTRVRGLVITAVPSGRVKGLARLAFDFEALVLEGKEHAIGARPVDIAAANSHTKDPVLIGIGVGARISGNGTGVVLTKKGKEVELGTGTRMTVRLTRETRL